jgi:hypothetical protein
LKFSDKEYIIKLNSFERWVFMNLLSKTTRASISALLAVLMLLSVFVTGAPAAFAAETGKTQTSAATPDELAADNIDSINIEPITVYKYIDSEDEWFYDEGTETSYEFCYYYYSSYINGSLTLKDGTEISVDNRGFKYDGKKYTIKCKDDQYNNHWDVGAHKAILSFNGYNQEIDINVVELKVKKVEVQDVEAVMGLDTSLADEEIYDEAKEEYSVVNWTRVNYDYDFKVYLEDGTALTYGYDEDEGDYGLFYKGRNVYSYTTDDQSYNNEWTVGEHDAKLRVLGIETPFKVKVLPSPVKSVEISDVTVYAGMDASDYDGSFEYSPSYKVTLNDGTVLESDEDGDVRYKDRWYSLYITDDQSEENPWDVGTHKATGTVMGVNAEFNVNVKPNIADNVKIEDLSVYNQFDWDEDDECYYMYPDFSVTLDDGTVVKGSNNRIRINGKSYRLKIDNKYRSVKWTGGQHKVVAKIFGKEISFNVNVYDGNVVRKIEPEDITVTAGVDTYGYNSTILLIDTKAKLTLVDGNVVEADEDGEFSINGKEYTLDFESDQSINNIWKDGVHKATASFGDVSAEYNVTVKPSPFAKVEFEDVVIYKDIDIHEASPDEVHPEGGMIYFYNSNFTLTDVNGNKYSNADSSQGKYLSNRGIIYNGEDYFPAYVDDQSVSAWDIGVHKVKGIILGVEGEFNVEVKPNPIESISCDGIDIIENSDGYYDCDYIYDEELDEEIETEEYFVYGIPSFKLKLKMTDGTTQTVDAGSVYVKFDNKFYDLYIDELVQSYNNQLKVGDKQTLKGKALGKDFTAVATIVGTPVKSATISTLYVIDGYDDFYDDYGDYDNKYYNVSTRSMKVTLTLADGTVLTGDRGYVEYNNSIYEVEFSTDQSGDNKWKVGNTYTVDATILGFKTKFDVKVIENPIASVVFDDAYVDESDLFNDEYYDEEADEYIDCQYYIADPGKFTVKLKDGRTIESVDGSVNIYGRNFNANVDDHYQKPGDLWTIGNVYTTTASVVGVEAPIKVHVVGKGQKPADNSTDNPGGNSGDNSGNTPGDSSGDNSGNTPGDSSGNNSGNNSGSDSGKSVTPTNTNPTVKPAVKAPAKSAKKVSPMTAKTKKKTLKVKASKLKKKAVTIKALKIKNAKGKLTYKKISGKKFFKVNKKTGKITIKKGAKKKTYKIKIRVTDAGGKGFAKTSKTVTVKIKIK